jgi:hypothetical protein
MEILKTNRYNAPKKLEKLAQVHKKTLEKSKTFVMNGMNSECSSTADKDDDSASHS